MTKQKKYKLLILLGHQEGEKLEEKIKKALRKHLDSVELSTKESQPGVSELSIKGENQAIDACHTILNRKVLCERAFVRLEDQLGQEIRRKAYPLLSGP